MKIVAIVLGALLALALVVVVIGWLLPVRHQAAREATLPVSAEALYAIIADVERGPTWRRKLDSVEIVVDGSSRFREIGADGAILYRIEEAVPGKRFATRIVDESLPFGGTWTFDLTPSAAGTTLRITEDGEVYNPLYHFVSRFVIGHHATIDRYLADLVAKTAGQPKPPR